MEAETREALHARLLELTHVVAMLAAEMSWSRGHNQTMMRISEEIDRVRTKLGDKTAFVALEKPIGHHDMKIGPCSCGAWHREGDVF